MMRLIRQNALYLAWVISLVGMFTSLYMSEEMLMPVCHLCWYQRVCMYPLVFILGAAYYYQRRDVFAYAFPLTVLGVLFAIYQYMEQMIPGFSPLNLCGSGISCSSIHVKLLGFITLPLMSAGMFVVLGVLLFMDRQS